MALGHIGKRIGKYECVDILGHGATSIVYLAWDSLLRKQVALKVFDIQSSDGDVNQFLEEARLLDRLNHRNIVQVHSVDRVDGKILIAMEYVPGVNLQELLRQQGKLPVRQALDIAIQVLDALDYAHRNHIVHRDVKPGNILISKDGVVKLVDFGLATILGTGSYAGGAGTYVYMAPEDFAGEKSSDCRSDLWAVGVTLYEMVTGHRPFNAANPRNPFSWQEAVQKQQPPPLQQYVPDAPSALQTVIERALAKRKDDRYQRADEFKQALRRVQAMQSEAGDETLAVVSSQAYGVQQRQQSSAGAMPKSAPKEPVESQKGFLKILLEITGLQKSFRRPNSSYEDSWCPQTNRVVLLCALVPCLLPLLTAILESRELHWMFLGMALSAAQVVVLAILAIEVIEEALDEWLCCSFIFLFFLLAFGGLGGLLHRSMFSDRTVAVSILLALGGLAIVGFFADRWRLNLRGEGWWRATLLLEVVWSLFLSWVLAIVI